MNAPWWLAQLRAAWKRKRVLEKECRCDGTWKAMRWVVANWWVAGIGKE